MPHPAPVFFAFPAGPCAKAFDQEIIDSKDRDGQAVDLDFVERPVRVSRVQGKDQVKVRANPAMTVLFKKEFKKHPVDDFGRDQCKLDFVAGGFSRSVVFEGRSACKNRDDSVRGESVSNDSEGDEFFSQRPGFVEKQNEPRVAFGKVHRRIIEYDI